MIIINSLSTHLGRTALRRRRRPVPRPLPETLAFSFFISRARRRAALFGRARREEVHVNRAAALSSV